FFTYELRVGHTGKIWSTAQGRFGHPFRLAGVQHPAPPLTCTANRTPDGIFVAAQHAVAVFNGRNVTSHPPKTEIWAMLYAQVRQADASQNRNFLLAEIKLTDAQARQSSVITFLAERTNKEIKGFNSLDITVDAPPVAAGQWDEKEIQALLQTY